jgi:hypothetical protein
MTGKTGFSNPPDNAALLYPHAGLLANKINFDLLKQLIECAEEMIEPNKKIKKHISIILPKNWAHD